MKKTLMFILFCTPTICMAACPTLAKLAGTTFVCTVQGDLGGQTRFGSAVHATSKTGVTSLSNWALFAPDNSAGADETDSGNVSVTSNAQYASGCTLLTSTAFESGLSSTNVASYVNNGAQLEIRGVRSDGLIFRATCLKP